MPATKRKRELNRSADDRRLELIGIVFDEIAEKGFEGLRFQEVAAAAGINNATLYYYFPSKEAMIQSLVEWLLSGLTEEGSDKKGRLSSAMEELRAVFEDLYRRLTKDPRFFVVITELALRAQRDPVIAKIGRERNRSWEGHLRAILERGIKDGSFRKDLDIPAVCLALMVQMKGIGHHAAMEKRRPSELRSVVDEILVQVVKRLAPI